MHDRLELNREVKIKGAQDNIFKFSFCLNFIYHVKIDSQFTNTKRKIQKIPSESEEIISF